MENPFAHFQESSFGDADLEAMSESAWTLSSTAMNMFRSLHFTWTSHMECVDVDIRLVGTASNYHICVSP